MHVNSILPALLLLSAASAQVSTKSLVTCVTKQGPKSTSSVKTTSKVLTIPWYALRVTTYTPSITKTPATSTQTVSSTTTILTTTTLPVETDTLTTTLSVTSTDLATTTTTTTSTAVQTVTVSSTDTTTIAATAGFIPVETSAPGTVKRSEANLADENALEERQTSKTQLSIKNGKLVCNPAVYPQSVQCVGVVAVITTSIRTKTASKTRTVTAPTPIITATAVFSSTSTITETPARASTTSTVTTTISTSSTVTSTSTTVTTVTNTLTVVAPQATFYAACADDNIISSIDGQGISSAYVNNNVGQSFVNAASAYDCCVACINTAGCGAAAFFNDGATCDLIALASGTCSQSNSVVFISPGSSASFSFTNGYCGSVARA